jgi:hypothetical protein
MSLTSDVSVFWCPGLCWCDVYSLPHALLAQWPACKGSAPHSTGGHTSHPHAYPLPPGLQTPLSPSAHAYGGLAVAQVVCPALHYAQTLHTLIGFKVYLYNFQFGPMLTDLAVEAGLTNPVYKESHHWASHGSSIPFLFHNLCRKCHHRGCASQKVCARLPVRLDRFPSATTVSQSQGYRSPRTVHAERRPARTASTTDIPILP